MPRQPNVMTFLRDLGSKKLWCYVSRGLKEENLMSNELTFLALAPPLSEFSIDLLSEGKRRHNKPSSTHLFYSTWYGRRNHIIGNLNSIGHNASLLETNLLKVWGSPGRVSFINLKRFVMNRTFCVICSLGSPGRFLSYTLWAKASLLSDTRQQLKIWNVFVLTDLKTHIVNLVKNSWIEIPLNCGSLLIWQPSCQQYFSSVQKGEKYYDEFFLAFSNSRFHATIFLPMT